MPTKVLDKNQIARALKAANYSGRAGSTIIGNLTRGGDGKFSSGGGGAPAPKPSKADTSARQREARQQLADQQRQERQSARDQAKTDAQQKAVENVGNLADKLLDSDMAEVLTVGDPLGNIDGVNPEYGDKLVARGLANKYPDGSYDLSPTGRTMVNAMKKGNERAAKIAIMRAQAVADRKAATAARRAKRGKKEQFALAIKAVGSFTAYKEFAGKDFFGLDVPEVDEAEPEHTGVMVAFYIDTFSPDAAVQLQVPGGETWDALHLTLAYLGDSTELGQEAEYKLYGLISQFAAGQNPIEGKISGIGLFNNTEEGDSNAFYASFDSPSLPAFRQGLMDLLQSNELVRVQNHGFTPHITLQYVPKGLPFPQVELPSMPLIFTKVTVKWGDKRQDFSIGLVTKAVKNEIAAKELNAKPFMAYKDISGRWRWLVRSSSTFEDRDGEFVTQKALEQAVEKLNVTGRFGVLDWWHTPVKLGTCDFSAMHGKVLVESGTFVNEQLGERISSAISNKEFNPGVSLMFSYNGPEPRGRGRVFDDIGIIQRSLLPEEIASNAVTTMEIVNLAAKSGANTEEVNLKMDAVKEQRLIQLLGPALVKEFLNGSEMAEKSLEMAGVAYKAVAPPPMDGEDPAGIETKADGAMPEDPTAEAPEPPAEEPVEEEPMVDGDSPDAMLADFFAEIKDMVMSNMGEYVSQLQAAITSAKPVASKEITDLVETQALALKETTNILEKFGTDLTALKAAISALEGKQPPVVAQRASAAKSNQVTDPKLLDALKAQNQPTVDPNDPFAFAYTTWHEQGAPLPLNR